MPEFRYAKGRIADSIRFISEELREFDDEYAGRAREEYQADRKLQKLIDRTVENILTALIEICGTFLSEQGGAADSYAEALRACAGQLGFQQGEQEQLAALATIRNRLAHRYLNFRWQAIEDFSKKRGLVTRVVSKILQEIDH
jgi:uncharacterized protein YutE (UPF0331/DUF86 family)